ncbi:MAG: YncE family protein [Polyangiaceae bacterium]|nr:YncE family protein [Polyangiaceae bacterium]
MKRRAARAVALACAVGACGGDAQVVDEPYTGRAFPPPAPLTLPAGPWAVTSNNGADTLTFVDLAAGAVVAEVPVGLNPIDLDGPHHLAVDRQTKDVFVALSYPAPPIIPGPHAAHGSAAVNGKLVRLSLPDFSILGVARLDPNPGDIVLSDDGGRAVVTHFALEKALNPTAPIEAQRARLLAFSARELVGAAPPAPRSVDVCVAPHGVALSHGDGRRAYVACYGEDALAIVDLADESQPVTRVPVGPNPGRAPTPAYGPYAIAIDDASQRVAVGTTESHELRVFDATGALLADKTWRPDVSKGGVFFPVFLGDLLVVPVQRPDALYVLDLSGPATEVRRRVFAGDECQSPHEVRRSTVAGELLVVCEGDHRGPGKLLIVDEVTLATRATLLTGAYPDRVEALP